MRICIVSVEYPPFRGGGIGTYALNMSRFLADAGHEVHVICNRWTEFSNEEVPLEERHDNLWIHRVDSITDKYGPRPPYEGDESPMGKVCRWWDSSLFWSTMAADKLEQVYRDHRIEVVEYPECYAESYVAMRRRRLGRDGVDVPMTLTLHSPIHEVTVHNMYRTYEGWFRRRDMSEEYCIRQADMLSSPSQALVDVLRKRLALDPVEHPCEVIHNPMDFESLPDLPAPGQIRPDDPMSLLVVGRVEPRKGVKYLIDASQLLMDRYPKLKVHFIGKDCDAGEAPGSVIEFMRGRIRPEFTDRFVFEGLRPRAEVLQRYASATACIHPAPWDNFPYSVCEAMAYGAMVVASDNGGMAEMIEDGRSGLLFPTMNVPALASTIERVLNDVELRARCRGNAGARIREVCDPAHAVRKRIAHYERTIERHAASRAVRSRAVVAKKPTSTCVFIYNHTGVPAITRTIESVRRAARHAGMQVQISVVGTRKYHDLVEPSDGVEVLNSQLESDNSAVELWMNTVERLDPDYLVAMWPSEEMAQDYFEVARRVLDAEPKAAWTTTWLESCHAGQQEPYAGFDFSLPLEMQFYHAVPYALIRYEAYKQVGGWNFELPPGWRQWDLWLAFHQAGLEGIVVPEWHGTYIPYAQIKLHQPTHPKAFEMVLDRVVNRNRKLFERHGSTLWVTSLTNNIETPFIKPPPPEDVAKVNGDVQSLDDLSLVTLLRQVVRRVRILGDRHIKN